MKTFKAVPIRQLTGNPIVKVKSKNLNRLHFSYLHGILEKKSHYDIYMFVGKIPTKAGIYNVNVLFPDEVIESTLFLWSDGFDRKHGLLVANNDCISYQDAKEKYERKDICI